MLKLTYTPAKDTKTCHVYQTGEPRTPEHQTLYLKKEQVAVAGIDPKKNLAVTIEEEGE